MIKFALIFLLLLIFIVLWKRIEKVPAFFAKLLNIGREWQKRRAKSAEAFEKTANELVNELTGLEKKISMTAWPNNLLVFSATTADNREAEFIDEQLPEQHKLIRLLRALLITGFLLSTVWIILFWKH